MRASALSNDRYGRSLLFAIRVSRSLFSGNSDAGNGGIRHSASFSFVLRTGTQAAVIISFLISVEGKWQQGCCRPADIYQNLSNIKQERPAFIGRQAARRYMFDTLFYWILPASYITPKQV